MSRSLKSLALRSLLMMIHAVGGSVRRLIRFIGWSFGWAMPMLKRLLVRVFVFGSAGIKMIRSSVHSSNTMSSLWSPKRMLVQGAVVLVALVGTRGVLFASDQTTAPTAQPNIVAQILRPQPTTPLIQDSSLPILQPAGNSMSEDLSAVDPELLDLFVYDEETSNGGDEGGDFTDEQYAGIESPLSLPGSDIIPPAPIGPTRKNTIEYVVTDGDTVSSIAERFGISINTVLWENSLGAYSVIRPGQILKILPTSGISYIVKKGDTLSRIAKSTNSDVQEIQSYNALSDDGLVAGATIVIPRGHVVATTRPANTKVRTSEPVITQIPKGLDVSNIVGLVWPTVSRKINQYFRGSRHTGLDIKGSKGSPIYAADSGTVALAGWNRGGYGLQVIVKHNNGSLTRYAHSSKLLVKAGDSVAKGQVIALVGSTGRSTGPHLHFEVLKGSQRLNPLLFYK
ncbi:peptidoglycan DD-metalloendopeptidase family protein [Candidatus Uhrbacteria bacterium]|nr:peptidoglycan DD-metalloendopeptidase family protein [Candidatus Uhrbacteria bacterium]